MEVKKAGRALVALTALAALYVAQDSHHKHVKAKQLYAQANAKYQEASDYYDQVDDLIEQLEPIQAEQKGETELQPPSIIIPPELFERDPELATTLRRGELAAASLEIQAQVNGLLHAAETAHKDADKLGTAAEGWMDRSIF